MHTTDPPRIWLDLAPGSATPDVRAFRRRLHVTGRPTTATLRLFAEARYLLWINGSFIAAGPASHHPMRAPFDPHDLTAMLQPGDNVIAVLVQATDRGTHQHVPSGEPGMAAAMTWRDDAGDHRLETDGKWKASAQTGWVGPMPKRGWALGPIECFDARQAVSGWQGLGFDDTTWADACASPLGRKVSGGVTAVERPTPRLRHTFVPPCAITRFDAVPATVTPIAPQDDTAELGRRILALPRTAATEPLRLSPTPTPEAFSIDGLTAQTGCVVGLDLGALHVGQIVLRCNSPSEGVIDIAWGEVEQDGRAGCLRKGTSYVDRILATRGPIDWRPLGFSGMRYVDLVFRGFVGSVTVETIGLDATEPDLDWACSFTSSDAILNDIWAICVRTLRVGTQDALMDCPTREQATYIGDGHPVAKWIARLTGDTRYWRDLVREQYRRQAANGLIRSTLFSCLDGTLLDYVLIAILGTRDYLRWTGDHDTARAVLPAARRSLGWFDQRRGADGLLDWCWSPDRLARRPEQVYDPQLPTIDSLNLFIDHPGLGWHNPHDAGIDRRGTNAALHALLIMARQALAELEDAVGDPAQAQHQRDQAQSLARHASRVWFDDTRRYFVDGVLDDRQLSQVSEQTNTWAVLAELIDPDAGRDLLSRLIHDDDPAIARSGFYFLLYQLRALSDLGLMREAVDTIRRKWSPLFDAGATTVWETPAGDDLDSWCHPWSCVPASFLLTDVLGLGGLEAPDTEVKTIHPRYDLLDQADGAMFTRNGRCTLRWQSVGGAVTLDGELPPGVQAQVRSPADLPLGQVSGTWRLRVPFPR